MMHAAVHIYALASQDVSLPIITPLRMQAVTYMPEKNMIPTKTEPDKT